MEHKTALAVILMAALFIISIPFEKKYSRTLGLMAHEPATRLLAGIVLLYLSYHDIVLGAIAFVILFLWMSDIQLLSSLVLKQEIR